MSSDKNSPDAIPVDVKGASFSYGARRVLDAVSLDVGAGEIVGLLGPNGSGKSTLVKLLSGVMGGYEGNIRLWGEEAAGLSRKKIACRLAVVPQEPHFSFPFTVLETVLMGRHPHLGGLAFESSRDMVLARGALERCGAAELSDRLIHELSAGERQRVVFARALAQEPEVLLLDEPASFLDIRHQVELYDLVRELAVEKKTAVLTVLHDLNLAAEYCDRLYLLRRGRVEAEGPTARVFTYANLTRVFETELYVDMNDLTQQLLAVPLSGRVRRRLAGPKTAPGSHPPEEGGGNV